MKLRFLFTLAAVLMCMSASFAQTMKVAYVNSDSILVKIPEYKVQLKTMEAYQKQLSMQAEQQQKEFETKAREFEQNKEVWAQLVLEQKYKELQQLEQNRYEFQQKAQQDIMRKEQELLAPLSVKMQEAIETVANEKGYTYVLHEQSLIVKDKSHNITQDVINKLAQ